MDILLVDGLGHPRLKQISDETAPDSVSHLRDDAAWWPEEARTVWFDRTWHTVNGWLVYRMQGCGEPKIRAGYLPQNI